MYKSHSTIMVFIYSVPPLLTVSPERGKTYLIHICISRA